MKLAAQRRATGDQILELYPPIPRVLQRRALACWGPRGYRPKVYVQQALQGPSPFLTRPAFATRFWNNRGNQYQSEGLGANTATMCCLDDNMR